MKNKKCIYATRKNINKHHYKKYKFRITRILNCILALLVFFVFLSGGTNTNFRALDVYGSNYTVSSENDLKDALAAINISDEGAYSITLDADIVIESNLELKKNSVTIYGENHALSFVKSYLVVKGNATLNLGNANYNKTLLIKDSPPQTGNACTPLISASNATLNMYGGVTISGRNGVDTAGGVQLEKSTFNMYGGEISDCRSDTAAGGVLVCNNSRFKMFDGTIKNCNNSHYGGGVFARDNSQFEMMGGTIKNCNSSGSGGGVYVYNSQFEMNDGTIQNCTGSGSGGGVYVYNSLFEMNSGEIKNCNSTNYGGGVHVYGTSQFKMTGGIIKNCTNSAYGGGGVCIRTTNNNDSYDFEIDGGEITDCTSTSNINYGLGGGIFIISGSVQIKDNSKIYNNHASRAGDDIFSYGTNTKLKLGNVPEGLILSDTNYAIDGWYVDGVINGEDTDRWDKDNFAQKYTPLPEELIETQIALKAAHASTGYNYYNYTVKYYIDGKLNEELTQTGTANTVNVDNISAPNKYKIDFIDYINIIEPTSQTPGSFEVNVYCSESDNEEDLPKHKTDSNDTINSLVNEDDTDSEQYNSDNKQDNPQELQTGESNLELYIIFGTLFASVSVLFVTFFNRSKQKN